LEFVKILNLLHRIYSSTLPKK